MTADEIGHIARIAVSLGVTRIKLTGGEPLMRKDLCEVVKKLASIPHIDDLSLTTNGTMLDVWAKQLCECGLKRVNISLPTLNPKIYHKLTEGRIQDVLRGVESAVSVGLFPVKLNMVVLNDVNNDEIQDMMNYASKTGTILQLIELDPVNVDDAYFSVYHETLDEIERMLRVKASRIETRRYMHNRHVYHLSDGIVEVVHPTENSIFCQHCTRLRVTSDGKLKPCLMRNDNLVDLLTPMRTGVSDEKLKDLFIQVNDRREPFNKAA
jgi:cyclic pyranopterin phosphate synthase